jgi:hypothetical protein
MSKKTTNSQWRIKTPSQQNNNNNNRSSSGDEKQVQEFTSIINHFSKHSARNKPSNKHITSLSYILASTRALSREEALKQIQPVVPVGMVEEDGQLVMVFSSWKHFHQARCADGNVAASPSHKLRYFKASPRLGGATVKQMERRVDLSLPSRLFGSLGVLSSHLNMVRDAIEALPQVERVFVRNDHKNKVLQVAVIPLLDRDNDLLSLSQQLEGMNVLVTGHGQTINSNNNSNNNNNNKNKTTSRNLGTVRIERSMIRIRAEDSQLCSLCTKCMQRGHTTRACTSHRVLFEMHDYLLVAQIEHQLLPLLNSNILVPSGCSLATNRFIAIWTQLDQVREATTNLVNNEAVMDMVKFSSTQISKGRWKEMARGWVTSVMSSSSDVKADHATLTSKSLSSASSQTTSQPSSSADPVTVSVTSSSSHSSKPVDKKESTSQFKPSTTTTKKVKASTSTSSSISSLSHKQANSTNKVSTSSSRSSHPDSEEKSVSKTNNQTASSSSKPSHQRRSSRLADQNTTKQSTYVSALHILPSKYGMSSLASLPAPNLDYLMGYDDDDYEDDLCDELEEKNFFY